MKKIKLPTNLKTKLYVCPTGCTQRRTDSYWLAEKRTFNGRKCDNCGFTVRYEIQPIFTVYRYSEERVQK